MTRMLRHCFSYLVEFPLYYYNHTVSGFIYFVYTRCMCIKYHFVKLHPLLCVFCPLDHIATSLNRNFLNNYKLWKHELPNFSLFPLLQYVKNQQNVTNTHSLIFSMKQLRNAQQVLYFYLVTHRFWYLKCWST